MKTDSVDQPSEPIAAPSAETRAAGLARQLHLWAQTGLSSTAYLATGGVVTSPTWDYCADADGLLSIEGNGGLMFLVNPAAIVAIGLAENQDVPERFEPVPGSGWTAHGTRA